MAQKINASALRIGTTQLWKFESNPNFYTSSNINFLFVYLFLKSELKKHNYMVVDIKKTEKYRVSQLKIFVFNLYQIRQKKSLYQKFKFKKYNRLKKTFKFKNNSEILNLKVLPFYAYSFLNQTGYLSSEAFQLKQKLLKTKIKQPNIKHTDQISNFLKKTIRRTKQTLNQFIALRRISFLLEEKINKLFKLECTLKIKESWNYLKERNNRLFSRIEKKLFRFRRNPLTSQLANIIVTSIYFRSTDLLSQYIATQISIQKKINFFIKQIELIIKILFNIQKFLYAIKIEIWGKRFKSGRTKKTKIVCGSLKTSNLSLPGFESINHAFTKFGTFGIRTIFIIKND